MVLLPGVLFHGCLLAYFSFLYFFSLTLGGLCVTIVLTHGRTMFLSSSAGFQGKNYSCRTEMPHCYTWEHEEENQWVVSEFGSELYLCSCSLCNGPTEVIKFWVHFKADLPSHPPKKNPKTKPESSVLEWARVRITALSLSNLTQPMRLC